MMNGAYNVKMYHVFTGYDTQHTSIVLQSCGILSRKYQRTTPICENICNGNDVVGYLHTISVIPQNCILRPIMEKHLFY